MKNFINNQLKIDLKKNILTIGSWLSIPSTVSAEIMSQAGFPWLVIDMEHSVIDFETMQSMLLAIELNKCIPIVRLSGKDPNQIKRVLDAGSYGIIVPMVNNQEEAKFMINSIKYPPTGERSVGLARAQGYGINFNDYINNFNQNSIIIFQIESKIAVENIEKILSVKGVDGIILGPYDLSSSYGVPGDLENSLVMNAEKIVLDAAKKHDIPAGIHVVEPNSEILNSKVEKGFKFIAFGVDMIFLGGNCKKAMTDIKKFSS